MKRLYLIFAIVFIISCFLSCNNAKCVYCSAEYKGEFIDSIKLANSQYYYSAYIPMNHKLKKLPTFIFLIHMHIPKLH